MVKQRGQVQLAEAGPAPLRPLLDRARAGAGWLGVSGQSRHLVGASITGTRLNGCRVYGVAAWNVKGEPASSNDLIVTLPDEPVLLVDKLKLAQFMYLLLENAELRAIIDTLTSKAVLLLGRFTPERKASLDALRFALCATGYSPMLFDCDKPSSKAILRNRATARPNGPICRGRSHRPGQCTPFELGLLVSLDLGSTPLIPLIGLGQRPFSMLKDLAVKPA